MECSAIPKAHRCSPGPAVKIVPVVLLGRANSGAKVEHAEFLIDQRITDGGEPRAAPKSTGDRPAPVV